MERTIEARATVRAPLERTFEIIEHHPEAVFGPRAPQSPGCHLSTVAVSLGRGLVAAQAVELELGPAIADPEIVRWPISWRPTAHNRVLPTLRGTISARRDGAATTTLVLEGRYQPPLGFVGGFGDGVVGHRLARRCTEDHLEAMARRITTEAAHRTSATFVSAPYPPDLRPFAGEGA